MTKLTIFIFAYIAFPVIVMIAVNIWTRRDDKRVADEFVEDFMIPHLERGLEAGISRERLDELAYQAFHESESDYPLRMPAGIFRDLVDAEIATVRGGGRDERP